MRLIILRPLEAGFTYFSAALLPFGTILNHLKVSTNLLYNSKWK